MKWHSKEVVFLIFSVMTLVIAGFGFFFGPVHIPIWYSLPVSEQQIDQKIFLFVFPISCLVIVFVHSFFIRMTKKIDATMGRIILWSSLIPFSILTIALVHILVVTL